MTNTKKLLPIHIGMHKTGSTFLQHVVFPRLFPEWGGRNSGREWNLLISEIAKHVQAKNPEGSKQLTQAANSGGGLLVQPSIFISSESLSGRQKCNYPGESIERFNGFMDGLRLIGADREIKVVIFFRKHLEYLQSAYLHQHRRGSRRSWSEFYQGFGGLDLSWAYRAQKLAESDIECRLYDYADLRINPSGVMADVARFFNKQPVNWASPPQRVNAAPKTIIPQYMSHYCSIFSSIVKRGGVKLDVNSFLDDRIMYRVDRFASSIRMPSIDKLKRSLSLPKMLEEKFEDDWQALRPYLRQFPHLD